jgi:AMIN domain
MIQAQAARRAAAQQAAASGQVPAQPAVRPALQNQVPPSQVPPNQVPQGETQPNQTGVQPALPAGVATYALPPAAVKSVKIIREKSGSAIEITTSRPVPPALQTEPNPPRLVIDLPNANVAVKDKHIAGKGEQFTDVHVDQFQVTPPVTRVVGSAMVPR